MKNPIMRYMHDEEPIGKIVKAKVDDKGLYVKAELVNSPHVPLANKAWALIQKGVVKSFSIGGRVLKRGEGAKENVIEKLWLAEISIVDIPANKNSLFSVVQKAMNEVIELVEETKEEVKEETTEEKPEETEAEKTEEEKTEETPTEEKEEETTEEEAEESEGEEETAEEEKAVETELRKEIDGLKKRLAAMEKPSKKVIKEAMIEVLKEAVKAKKKKSQVTSKDMTPEEKKKEDEAALSALVDTTKTFGGSIDI